MNKDLPIEIINKILIMRPSHPIVKILREYVNDRTLGIGGENHIFYCRHVYHLLKNNDCFMMEDFNYRYKNYRRMYKNVIESLNRRIKWYKKICTKNDSNKYTFLTYIKYIKNMF